MTARRLAVLCASVGRARRGIETVVEELVLERLGRDWPVDLYGPPESPALPPPHRVIRVPCGRREDPRAAHYDGVCGLLRWPMPGGHNYEALSFAWRLLDTPLPTARYLAVFNFAGPYAAPLCRLNRALAGSRFIHSGQAGLGPVEVLQAVSGPDLYAPLSPPARDWLAGRRLLDGETEVIPNGVDTGYFAPGSGTDFGLPRPVVLFAGALDEMKRPLLAVAAVAAAGGSLVAAGDGPQREAVARAGAAQLPGRFRLLGAVGRDELPALYQGCDIVTLPSQGEPFGIVLLEAMACGKPVVTEDDPVRRWLVGDAGVLCDCADLEGYAAALRIAAATDWGGRPRARALVFDWETIAAAYRERLREWEVEDELAAAGHSISSFRA